MTSIVNMTAAQLRRAADIQERITELQQELERVSNGVSVAPGDVRGRRRMSPAGRARIAAAARARWAAAKAKKASSPIVRKKRRRMSARARAAIAAAARARWAKAKAAGKKRL